MKRHWTLDELVEYFTLTDADRTLLLTTRADHTRLGLAVLLKSFQLDGRFPHGPHEVPAAVIQHLAQQLAIDPAVYLHYDWRGRVIDEHRALVRAALGVRASTNADLATLTITLTAELMQSHSRHLNRLRSVAIAHCRAQLVEPPTPTKLERVLHAALAAYDDQFCAQILKRLPDLTVRNLEALLTMVEPADPHAEASDLAAARRTVLHILKSDVGAVAVETATTEVTKLHHLRALALPSSLFADVPPRLVQALRQRVVAEELHELRRHPTALRLTLLAAFAWQRQREVTDTLIDLLIKMIRHIGRKAEQKVDRTLVAELKKVVNKTAVLRKLATAAVEHPDGIVREVLYPVVGEQVLKELVTELGTTERVIERSVQTTMRRSYGHHYRRMVPPILAVLQFRSHNAVYRPLIGALELLTRYADSDATHYGPILG